MTTNTTALSLLTLCAALAGIGCAHETPAAESRQEALITSGDEGVCGEPHVYFASGSAELSETARARLDSFAGCLTRHELDTLYVVGMTDPEGDADANLALGRERARAVADYLRARGCEVAFIIRSLGEAGATPAEPLWPLERSASVTATAS
jgi:outer membrane protein OmpA-like peptidoglycan-associated protein